MRQITYIFIVLIAAVGVRPGMTQQALPAPGDTIYSALDQLPSNVNLAVLNALGQWNFTGLQSPYVNMQFVRAPGQTYRGNASMLLPRPDGSGLFVVVEDGEQYVERIQITSNGEWVKGKCVELLPLGPQRADSVTNSTVHFNMDADLEFLARVRPDMTYVDSMRVIVELERKFVKASEGELVTNERSYYCTRYYGEQNSVAELWGKTLQGWQKLSDELPFELPDVLQSGNYYQFWSSDEGIPVATVWINSLGTAERVEYLASPQQGRVVEKHPQRSDIFVYPNPSYGLVRFDLVNLPAGAYSIEIYNIPGVKLRTREFEVSGTKTVMMNLTDLKKGTYIYRLIDISGRAIRSKRLVIISP